MKTNRILTAILLAMLTTTTLIAGPKFNLNGLQIELDNCTPYADGIVVNATFTNTAGTDVAFKVNNYFEDQCYVIDQDGNQQQLTDLIIGGRGAAGSDFRTIPQDISMKGQIYFRHISDRDSNVKQMKLDCRVTKDGSGEEEKDLVFNDIPITPLNNTNLPNTKITDPSLTMNTKSLTIDGKNALLRFALTSNNKDRYNAPVGQITAYDEDGNTYESESSITYMKLEPDEPQAFVITISGVPADLKKFALIRCMFDEWGHKMEWKNIEVESDDQ